jgi:hypothetical protein
MLVYILDFDQACLPPLCCSSIFSNLIKSSILKIVIAASVANLKIFNKIFYLRLLTLLIAGSKTPAKKLFLIFP